MSDRSPKIAVTVTEVVEVTPLIKRFRLEAANGALSRPSRAAPMWWSSSTTAPSCAATPIR